MSGICDALKAIRPLGPLMNMDEVVDAEDDVEEEMKQHGRREVQKMNDPKMPSKEEVEKHNMSHLPCGSRRRHCVRGKGKELAHKKANRETEMHEFHFDWACPGEEEPRNTLVVMVGRLRNQRMTMSTVVPTKTTGELICEEDRGLPENVDEKW